MDKVADKNITFPAILDLVREAAAVITKRAKVGRTVLIRAEMQTKIAMETIEPALEEGRKVVVMAEIVAWVTIDATVSTTIGGNTLGTVEGALTTMTRER